MKNSSSIVRFYGRGNLGNVRTILKLQTKRGKNRLCKWAFRMQGYLLFTRENRKFHLENQMVRAIPFGKLQKTWAVIWGDAIFLLF